MELDNIASIILFLAVILTSIFFAYLGQKTGKKTFSILSILLPVLLASFRYSSGTDSMTYRAFYEQIGNSDFAQLLERFTNGGMEPFIIIVSIIGNLLRLPVFVLFFIFAFITAICLKRVTNLFNHKYSWLLYGSLLLVVFPEGFNMMRQLAAVSVQAVAMMEIINLCNNNQPIKIKRTLLLLLFSVTLHFSSVLLLPLFIAPAIIKRIRRKSLVVILSAIAALCIFAFPFLIELVMNIGLLPEKHYETLLGADGSVINIKFFTALALTTVLFANYHRKNAPNDKQLLSLMLLGVSYSAVGFYSSYLGRLSEFFWVFIIIIASDIICQLFEKESCRIGVNLAAAIIYFVIYFGILGFNAIIPYSFGL